MNLANKKVTIIGARRSGIAAANLVSQMGGRVKISDQASYDSIRTDLERLKNPQDVKVEWGRHTVEFIEDSDLIVLSPGVPRNARPIRWAKAQKIPVLGEIELAWRFCSKPVVAVTGTNGKTTVATLIAQILEKAGRRPCLCGNVGTPFSEHALDSEDKDVVVLEVSSFQLESIVDFRPHVAVFLNFSQNHLDRHRDLEEYWEAKKRIFLNQKPQDYALLNADCPRMRGLAAHLKVKVIYFNGDDPRAKNPNQLAALAVARILGVDEEIALKVFREFKGVEHRLEWVRCVAGVHFINDSKATTAEASRWAIQNFERPIVMICGGRDKNIDFSVLRDLVKARVKKMLVIGEARDKIRGTFADVVALEECPSLLEAVRKSQKSAQRGEYVVFSPMCASFDMFSNFEERGKIFKKIVQEL